MRQIEDATARHAPVSVIAFEVACVFVLAPGTGDLSVFDHYQFRADCPLKFQILKKNWKITFANAEISVPLRDFFKRFNFDIEAFPVRLVAQQNLLHVDLDLARGAADGAVSGQLVAKIGALGRARRARVVAIIAGNELCLSFRQLAAER